MTQSIASPAISFVSQLPFVTRSFVAASFLLALATGGVVIHVAGIPPPAVGTVGENGPATEAALNNAEDVASLLMAISISPISTVAVS